MCGRFTLTDPTQDLAVQFNLPEIPDMQPRYNIAPTQPVAAVRVAPESAARELTLLHWGLIPFWAKDLKIGSRMINARPETVSEKPAFRAAFRQRRCLVVADGFYEWQKLERGKQPFYIRLHDGKPFAFAGLWESWNAPDGSNILSCTIITTTPNSLLAPIHNRMPVILPPDAYEHWLTPGEVDAQATQPLLKPYPADEMHAYAVSRLVNNPANDNPQCILPAGQ